jgi:hypothetical protein
MQSSITENINVKELSESKLIPDSYTLSLSKPMLSLLASDDSGNEYAILSVSNNAPPAITLLISSSVS